VDYLLSTFHSQGPTDPITGSYSFVSLDTYNIWSLATNFFSNQIGKARMYYPVTAHLLGSWSYGTASTLLFLVTTMFITLGLAFRRRLRTESGRYVPYVAASAMALLMIATGASPHHFLLVLALVLLCRQFISGPIYYYSVGVLTITMFVSTYGSFGVGLSVAPHLAPALSSVNNRVTEFFIELYQNDRFITTAALANVTVLLFMMLVAFDPRGRPRKARALEVNSGAGQIEAAVPANGQMSPTGSEARASAT
jgi:hypothetical protein